MPALQRSVACIACLLPALAWALGVGGIDVSSGLNQPFDAKIAIVGNPDWNPFDAAELTGAGSRFAVKCYIAAHSSLLK